MRGESQVLYPGFILYVHTRYLKLTMSLLAMFGHSSEALSFIGSSLIPLNASVCSRDFLLTPQPLRI